MSQIYLVTEQRQLFDNDNYKIIGVEESLELLSPLTIVGLDTETEGFFKRTESLLPEMGVAKWVNCWKGEIPNQHPSQPLTKLEGSETN